MADINVNIVRETGGVSQAGFGTALILSSTAHAYTVYTSLADLVADFATDTVVYKMASALMGQAIKPERFAVAGVEYEAGVDPVTDLSAFLNLLVADGKDFYAVLQEQDDMASQVEVSTWVGTQVKIHFIRVDVLPVAYTGTLSNRTTVVYTSIAGEYPECAIAGYGLPRLPGSLTWKNVEISGVTSEVLTGSDANDLEAGRFNYVRKYYGRKVTSDGLLQGNLYIDQQRSQDFIQLRMEENIAQLLINNDKVPYDDTGIAQIVSVVQKTLNQGFRNGIIASNKGGQALFNVTSLSLADIPQSDIDARVLKSVEFEYIEAGAIENATITGRIVTTLGV